MGDEYRRQFVLELDGSYIEANIILPRFRPQYVSYIPMYGDLLGPVWHGIGAEDKPGCMLLAHGCIDRKTRELSYKVTTSFCDRYGELNVADSPSFTICIGLVWRVL